MSAFIKAEELVMDEARWRIIQLRMVAVQCAIDSEFIRPVPPEKLKQQTDRYMRFILTGED